MTKRDGANHLRPTFVPSGMKTPIPWRAAILFLLVSSAVLITFAAWGDAIDAWTRATVEKAGGDRVLVAAVLFLVLASDILLPVPSSLASTSCGLFLGLWTGFAVSFAAMSASAAAGYALGRFCSDRAARLVGASDMAALRSFQRRFGPWLLLAMRPVPVLAEASAVFAGIGRMPVKSAALQLALGNAVVSMLYAAVGARFSNVEGATWWAFLAATAVSGVFVAVRCALTRPAQIES